MRDVLIVVDLFQDFGHEDGERLLGSLASRHEAIARVLEDARRSAVPVIFVNDHPGVWDSDARRIVAEALAGPGGDQLRLFVPQPGECIVLKPRYSGFDHTPLAVLLEGLEPTRLVLIGMTIEGCIAQSAIDARELGYKVSIVPAACGTTDERLERVALEYLEAVVGVYLVDKDAFSDQR
jgi:nicotinamidase-related amidase